LYADFAVSTTQCFFAIFDGTSRKGTAQALAGISGVSDAVSGLEGVFNYTTAQTNVSFRLQAWRSVGGGNCTAVVDSAAVSQRTPQFTVQRIDSFNSQPVFIQSPVRAAATGIAPIAGEVGFPTNCTVNATTALTSAVNTEFGRCDLPIGCHIIEGRAAIDYNSGGSGNVALLIADINLSSATLNSAGSSFASTSGNASIADYTIRTSRRVCVTSPTSYYLNARMDFSTYTFNRSGTKTVLYYIRDFDR
jgi:hypothetical protein